MAKVLLTSIHNITLLYRISALNGSGLQYYHLNTRTSVCSFGREEWQAIIFGYKINLILSYLSVSPPAMKPSFRKIYLQGYYGDIREDHILKK